MSEGEKVADGAPVSSNGDPAMAVSHTADPIIDVNAGPAGQSTTRTYSKNVLVSGFKIVVFAASGLLLPAYLTHHLSPALYGGWILVLQLASYINYLDLGMQTAIAKYIAQYSAAADDHECNRHASAGAAISCVTGFLGFLLSVILSLSISHLFKGMPPAIAKDVSRGVLLVGASTAILLATSPFASFFIGMQRYAMPTFVQVANKILYVVVLIVMVAQHRSLTAMGGAVAVLNIATAVIQVVAWKMVLPQIKIRLSLVAYPIVKQMVMYCAVLGIWTSGLLIITGLDTTVVGHFDFSQTAFYAIAATPITFLGMVLQAALNPLMPAVSALSVTRTPQHLGALLVRSTRYIMLILQFSGLPLILFGALVLTLWVGPNYAHHSLALMRILLLAHIVRNICGPYATMVIATGRQKAATLSGVCEAVVNLVSSILLGKYYGAIGVAMGTLIGAVVGVLVHFLVSMPRTQDTIAVSPWKLFEKGFLPPVVAAIPTALLLYFFWQPVQVPYTLVIIVIWAVATVVLAWKPGLNASEHADLLSKLRQRLARASTV